MSLVIEDVYEPYFDGRGGWTDRDEVRKPDQAARSATTASSTIMPAGVARSRELPTGSTSRSS